jgi:fatty-acyl-CoA synthase
MAMTADAGRVTTIDDVLATARARYWRRVAVVTATARCTYGDLDAGIGVKAMALAELGHRPGNTVALLLKNGPDFIEGFLAALRAEAVVVPLDPRLRETDLRAVLRQARPDLAFAQQSVDGYNLGAALARLGLGDAGARDLGPRCTLLRASSPRTSGTWLGGDRRPAVVLFTSGTSGAPKPVAHSHRSLLAAAAIAAGLRGELLRGLPLALPRMARALRRSGLGLVGQAGRKTILTTFGFSGIGGFTLLMLALTHGDTLVIPPSLHPHQLLASVARERVSLLATTPSVLRLLLKVYDPRSHDVSSLRLIGLGGGPVDPELVRAARTRLRVEIVVSYGSTELGGTVLATRVGDRTERQETTVGRALRGVDVRILDEYGALVPPGQVGELACRTEGRALGALSGGAQAVEAGPAGYVRTGDLAVLDADGYVQVLGRVDDLILRDGQNVYPAEIEAVISSHPIVHAAAVVPLARPDGELRLCALVVKERDADLTGADLLAYCQGQLALYRVPDVVHFVDDLPITRDLEPRTTYLRRLATAQGPAAEAHATRLEDRHRQ